MINLCFIRHLPDCSCCCWLCLCFLRAAEALTQQHFQSLQVEVLAWVALCEYHGCRMYYAGVLHIMVLGWPLVLVAPKEGNFSPCVLLFNFYWTAEFYLCIWFLCVGLIIVLHWNCWVLSPSSAVVCTDWACGRYSHRVYPVLWSNWLS